MPTDTPRGHYSKAVSTGNVTGLAVQLGPRTATSLTHEDPESLKLPGLGGCVGC